MALLNSIKLTKLGYQGNTPKAIPGSLPTSELHVQGTSEKTIKSDHSILDMDGQTPERYVDNLPG